MVVAVVVFAMRMGGVLVARARACALRAGRAALVARVGCNGCSAQALLAQVITRQCAPTHAHLLCGRSIGRAPRHPLCASIARRVAHADDGLAVARDGVAASVEDGEAVRDAQAEARRRLHGASLAADAGAALAQGRGPEQNQGADVDLARQNAPDSKHGVRCIKNTEARKSGRDTLILRTFAPTLAALPPPPSWGIPPSCPLRSVRKLRGYRPAQRLWTGLPSPPNMLEPTGCQRANEAKVLPINPSVQGGRRHPATLPTTTCPRPSSPTLPHRPRCAVIQAHSP